MSKKVGNLWNRPDIEVWEIDGSLYCLHGWNGESYTESWETFDDAGFGIVNANKRYDIRPIYKEVAEDEWEIVGMEIR